MINTILLQFAQTYNSTYGSNGDSYSSSSANMSSGALMVLTIFLLVLVVVLFIPLIVGIWKIFVKAGRPGWAAIIPVYSQWVMYEISGKPGWWSLAIFVPFVGGILTSLATIFAYLQLGKNFGKNTTFSVVWLILFPFVGLFILGFGKDQYLGTNVGDSSGIVNLGSPMQPNQTQNNQAPVNPVYTNVATNIAQISPQAVNPTPMQPTNQYNQPNNPQVPPNQNTPTV